MLTLYRLFVPTTQRLQHNNHVVTGSTNTHIDARSSTVVLWNPLPKHVQPLLCVIGIGITLFNLVYLSRLLPYEHHGHPSRRGVMPQYVRIPTTTHPATSFVVREPPHTPQRWSFHTPPPMKHDDPIVCADTTTAYDDHAQVDRFLYDIRTEKYQDKVDACIPMHRWQMEYYPTCNVVHELHMSPDVLQFVAQGTTAAVYELVDLYDVEEANNNDPQQQRVVLKLPLFHQEDFELYHPDQYEMRRIDAVIQERLTSSPYVGNLHAFCGQSSIVPLATGGSIHDLIVSVRAGGLPLTELQKLQVCIQIAEGLAALHGIDCPDGRHPRFAHNDLDVSQHVFVNGIFQINDFSYGFMLLQDKHTHETCKGISHMGHWKYRAPEDFNYRPPTDEREEEEDNHHPNNNNEYQMGGPYLLDKADVFMMCNEFYMVLTNLWLLEELSRSNGVAAIAKGQRSPIPLEYQTSSHIGIQAIVHVLTTMCWHQRPEDRSTARQIADYLQGELDKIDDVVDSNHPEDDGAAADNQDPSHKKNTNSGRIVRITLPPLIQASGDYDEKM